MIAFALAVALSAAPAPYAIAVGHNGGAAGLAPLQFADDDALRFARWFSALEGAAPASLHVLATVDDATRAELTASGLELPQMTAPTRTALARSVAEVRRALEARPDHGADAAVYFFYAGHGQADRLLLEPEAAAEAAITGKELRVMLSELPAGRIVVLLDACRSASLFAERGGPDLTSEIRALEAKADGAPLGVLTAARSDRPAGESAALQGGVFSHVLASALAGAADVDGDQQVTFGELAAFVAFHTERLTGQRPWFEPPGGNLRAVAADLRGASALTLGPSVGGRVRVVVPHGTPLLAEVHAAQGRAVRLALPPGRYLVQRVADGVRTEASAVVSAEGSRLEAADFGAPASAERGEWDELTFGSPFGPEAVAALDVGWQSAQSAPAAAPWRHSFELSYQGAAAPFGAGGLEHGVEAGWRWAFLGPGFVGPRLGFHLSNHVGSGGPALVRRVEWFLGGGVRLTPARWVELSPWLGAGITTLWIERSARTAGDPAAPTVLGAVRADFPLGGGVAVWLEARAALAFVAVDGARTLTAAPTATLGLAYRR
ncbi:MAG: caspase family protein [Myxococcaceae bacterium]|nr:caspase family protein [Myxococcaceae bacterium]